MEVTSNKYLNGQRLLIDKPLNWTSFDVVGKVRYAIRKAFGIKKIKVGHAGTLDPLATGLLILCTGKETKQIASVQGQKKVYTGTIRLGGTTPSYDLETSVDATFPTEHITEEAIREAMASFEGELDQLPPIFSAKKIGGKKAYDLARAGDEVHVKPNRIHIKSFELITVENKDVKFRVECSKGTYIRSLAYDLGKALDSGGHLTELRRTQIGDYHVDKAWNVEELVEHIYRENAVDEG